VVLKLRLGRWRCHNDQCIRKTFVERLPSIVAPFARRTSRVAELVRLFCHAAGGRVSERLLARLAMQVSDNTILRHFKNYARNVGDAQPIRIVGIDDWCWRRGDSYETIIVDLERRKVIDVLPKRSVEETATWLKRHPEIEIVSRDRCGLYAQGARQGAPQAKQVADRFHLLQNLREAIEQQMTDLGQFAGRSLLPAEAGDLNPVPRQARRETRKSAFDHVQTLHRAGKTSRDIAEETGIEWRGGRWSDGSARAVCRIAVLQISRRVLQAILRISCCANGKPETGLAVICSMTSSIEATRAAYLTCIGS